MKKRKSFVLDYETQILDFEETQILLWHTYYRNYEFANALNNVFRMNLEREEGLTITLGQGKNTTILEDCAVYGYYDEFSRLLYFMVELPKTESLQRTLIGQYDKLLFINGRDSVDKQKYIYTELQEYNQPVNSDDPGLYYHRYLVKDMVVNGIMDIDYLNLSNELVFDTSILERMGLRDDEKTQKLKTDLVMSIDVIMRGLSVRLLDVDLSCE